MRQIFEILNQGWVGTTIGLVGVFTAVVLYWLSRAVAILAAQHEEVRLIGGSDAAFPDEVRVLFRDVVVPRLTLTRVWIWNAGKKGVRGADIVASDPLRIELSGSILKATLLRQTRDVIQMSVMPRPDQDSQALIAFDFLDPGDGALVELLHSGPQTGPKVSGTVRGLPKGVRDWGRAWQEVSNRLPRKRRARQVMYIMMLFLGLFSLGMAAFRPQIEALFPAGKVAQKADTDSLTWGFVVMGILYTIAPASILWMRRRRFPRSLLLDSVAEGEGKT